MADFTMSTHRAKWIFTAQDLKEKYKEVNQRARQALDRYGATRMEVDIDGSSSYAEPQNDKDIGTSEKHSRTKPLKIEEEQLMRAFYEFKIQDVCDALKFPRKIQATALIYFKRFYLQWSVMEHHPKNIMLTSIYAACKVEENHVSAEELGKGIEQDHHMILNNEMLVLQSLGFDLIVYAPYRALEGFISDVEEFCGANEGQLQMIKELHESAKAEVDKIMRTDAPLLFPPGQKSYVICKNHAALHLNGPISIVKVTFVCDSMCFTIVLHNWFISWKTSSTSHAISELSLTLNMIDTLINKLETPTSKDVKHIDRKLKSCLDPSSHDKSKKRKHRSKEGSVEHDMS